MKLDFSITSNRINRIKEVLRDRGDINIKSLAKKANLPETTTSLYIQNYLKDIYLIKKIGKEKRVFLITDKPSLFEKNLEKQNNKLFFAKELRKKGFSYSEIKGKIKERGFSISDGTLSQKLRILKMGKDSKKRYLRKITEDRREAGKIGGKIRLSMKDFKDFQLSGTEALIKKALKRIPASSKRLTKEKIWIIGHCIFDGSVINKKGYSVVAYTNKSRYLINQFKKNMFKVYHLSPTDLRKREGGVYVIRYCSIAAVKDISPLIKKEIPGAIMNSCKNDKIIFLKTFWDDEGMIHFGAHKDSEGYMHISRYVEAYCENDRIREQLKSLHESLGFRVKEYHKKIRISKRNDLKIFSDTIGFSKGIFVSYPKSNFDGVEKGKVLNMAIKSYT